MLDGSAGKPAAMQSGPALPDDQTASAARDGYRMARLVRTIEGEIIPRLLVSLSGSLTTVRGGVDAANVEPAAELARIVLMRDSVGAADIVRMLYPEGPPQLDRVCLRLIVPAAQCLREIWERQECDFDQLLQGLGRLESVIRELIGRPARG